ncbi:MAG: right-handed parallel beta-helix repeat-containing protein [Rubrobacter sp.]|nr:right-handed parallel beta-helix repeat-containing protein [Rubrobacter sp.]
MKETNRALLAALVTMLLALFALAAPAHATTFTVNSTGDGQDMDTTDGQCLSGFMSTGSGLLVGECTLRAAIEQANATAGADTISFDISGTGVHTIKPASELPAITDPVTIDGYSQPGAKANTNGPGQGSNAALKIELNGQNAGALASGLRVSTSDSTVKGLVINRFGEYGIRLYSGNGGHVIEGNFIGTDASGTAALGNGFAGIIVNTANGAAPNTIGGTTPAARNVISGNRLGIWIHTTAPNLVQGNLIGTKAAGTEALGNSQDGVVITVGGGNTIGGTSAAARNVISGNGGNGVSVRISILGGQVQGNIVQGNYIGTDVTGTADLGNLWNGVLLNGACGTVRDNSVGGSGAEEGNVIAFNSGAGVRVVADSCASNPNVTSSAFGNSILSNSIFSNDGLGIDLGAGGVAANDTGDGDAGANSLQNFPILSSASSSPSVTAIRGTLNSTADTTFDVQFFASPAADPSGNGEGKTYLGQASVRTDGAGNAGFDFTARASTAGRVVSATATNQATGDTSEFSGAITVAPAPPNDNFADAHVIQGSTASVPGTTAKATREPAEPDHYVSNPPDSDLWVGDHSVWYSWTALGSGQTTIDTCQAGIDSILAVYTGSQVNNLTQRLADNNNHPDCPSGSWGSKVTFQAKAGTTYRIVVGDAGGLREDDFILKLAGPPNERPTITPLRPKPGSTTRDRTPLVRAKVSDSATNLAKGDIKLFVDGRRIKAFSYDRATDRLSFTPKRNLSSGRHTVRIEATDAQGLKATRKWSFKVVR